MAIPKNTRRIIIERDTELVVNSITDKIFTAKEIIN